MMMKWGRGCNSHTTWPFSSSCSSSLLPTFFKGEEREKRGEDEEVMYVARRVPLVARQTKMEGTDESMEEGRVGGVRDVSDDDDDDDE